MTNRIFSSIIIVILSGIALCPAADNGFERALLPLLENHCFNCHDEDTQKGDLALDWFSYEVKVLPDRPVFARVRYWGGDSNNRKFDILVDDQKIATQELNAPKPGQFIDVTYEIPSDLTKGKQSVTVKFQAHPGAMAGGIFGCRIMTSNLTGK